MRKDWNGPFQFYVAGYVVIKSHSILTSIFYDFNMIAMQNSHLGYKKNNQSNTLKHKIDIKILNKVINIGAKNGPVGWNG